MRNIDITELKDDLADIQAYRDLQNTPFDFGTGLITNDNKESEDAYYEIEEQNLECFIDNIVSDRKKIKLCNHNRSNGYFRKQKAKKRLEKLAKQGVYFVYEAENKESGKKYFKKFYLSGCRRYAKRETNRKVRQSKNDFKLKGCGYRKKFDYWNTLF